MTNFTTKQWQETFKKHDTTRETLINILPVLQEIDQVNASVAGELVRRHAAEDVVERHNAAWDALKRLINEIEKRKETE